MLSDKLQPKVIFYFAKWPNCIWSAIIMSSIFTVQQRDNMTVINEMTFHSVCKWNSENRSKAS